MGTKFVYKAEFYALISLGWLVLFTGGVLAANGWEAQAFVFERPAGTPAGQTWDIGYDGQWYYQIALDPAGAHSRLDMPNYRYQRILYPIAGRLLALGNPAWIPWSLLAINLIGVAGTVYLLAKTGEEKRVCSWAALLYAVYIGTLLVVRMDLLEVLAVGLGLAGWRVYRRIPRAGLALFAAAGLTKEIALVFPIALVCYLFLNKDWWRGVGVLAACLGTYAAWYGLLGFWFGFAPENVLKHRPEWLPFSGVRFLEDPASLLVVILWVIVPAAAGLFWAGAAIARDPRLVKEPEMILLLGSILVVTTLPRFTWEDPLAMLRAACILLAALILALAHFSPRGLKYLAAIIAPSVLIILLMPGLFWK